MRAHRCLVALALAAGVAAPRAAESCQLFGPYLGTAARLPLGCPVHVYAQPVPVDLLPTLTALRNPTEDHREIGVEGTDLLPTLTVLRGGVYVDATGTSTFDSATLTVDRTFVDCRGTPSTTIRILDPYQHYAIVPKGVSVGEQIGLGTGWLVGIQIVAAAPCPAPVAPTLACTDVMPCFEEPPFDDFIEEDAGCAAAGGGPASGLLLLGLVALRRRTRRRR